VHGQRQTARRGEGLGALINETGLDQRVGDELPQVLRRLPLHAGRNLFGEQFEQEVGHGNAGRRESDGCRLLVDLKC
jgi:hypothetical protein